MLLHRHRRHLQARLRQARDLAASLVLDKSPPRLRHRHPVTAAYLLLHSPALNAQISLQLQKGPDVQQRGDSLRYPLRLLSVLLRLPGQKINLLNG